MDQPTAIIIGAGPAGLTAAYELLTRTHIQPIVLEMSDAIGGISRTVNYKGNRIDIGGHRFFSKSDRVLRWWLDMLPLGDPEHADPVMLLRERRSRIYYLRKFFDYPIALSKSTVSNLGLRRMARIAGSYAKARLFPLRDEQNLEQFFINRFGKELYLTFFKSYTEKVWGVPCHEISAAWGAQRVKGLSITTAILHALRKPFARRADLAQKQTETSLIEQFLYPKFGPGQMWQTCAERIVALGGRILQNMKVTRVHAEAERVVAVDAVDQQTGRQVSFPGDYFFSTMPVQDLIRALGSHVPQRIRDIGEGLAYRDFITVGLLLRRLKIHEPAREGNQPIRDNWIYIQEPDVRLGRLQIFNNWSPAMVADPSTVWLGLEYFCRENDRLWSLTDRELLALGANELAKIGIIDQRDVLDGTVIRVPKTYPAYFGSYTRFDELRQYVDRFRNLYLIGRNGMHRYNNQDHSMLAAMTAVDSILGAESDRTAVWNVNTEEEYHETRKAA